LRCWSRKEPMTMNEPKVERCRATTQAGKPCRAFAVREGYCLFHSPDADLRRKCDVGRRVGGLRKAVPMGVTADDGPMPDLGTVEAVAKYLGELAVKVERGRLHPRVANSVTMVVNCLLRAFAMRELVAPVEIRDRQDRKDDAWSVLRELSLGGG